MMKNQQKMQKSPILGSKSGEFLENRLNQSERGRSMVEMLGVLAVVGVLSVGAISGYRYAMNKYRVNQTVNELNLLSHQITVAMMSKNGLSGTLKLGEPYDSGKLATSGYAFAAGCGESGKETTCAGQDKFNFTLQGVSEGVCKDLIKTTENMQYIKQVLPDVCATTDNTMTFVFEASDVVASRAQSSSPLPLSQQATCSGNGLFLYGQCDCYAGYIGSACETKDTTCSQNGTFDGNSCLCDSNHYGANCQFSISKCEQHGRYQVYGQCACLGTYGGPECDVENACHGGEVFANLQNSCRCPMGLYGTDCSLTSDPCGIHGSWNNFYGICDCTDGYEGAYCDQEQGTICKNGTWSSDGYGTAFCSCASDWSGADCSIDSTETTSTSH